MKHKKYNMPDNKRRLHYARGLLKVLTKPLVLFYAIRGNYPTWMLTPDDPVSPFGSGTTPGASREETQMKVYEKFGRYIGDVVWLGWRNSLYGISYYLTPDFLKDKSIQYVNLEAAKEELPNGTVQYWIRIPGTDEWLWETQRKYGPITVLSGYRIQPIYDGIIRAREGLKQGVVIKLPAHHPNMDGRPIFSFRTKRTM
jgi:hypothetical protein